MPASLRANTRVLATLRKNNVQEIRISAADHAGVTLVDVRIFEAKANSDGQPTPTKSGICLVRSKLPELIQALQAAEKAA